MTTRTGRTAKPPTTSAVHAALVAAGHAEHQTNGMPGGVTAAGFALWHSGRTVGVIHSEPWSQTGPAVRDRAVLASDLYADAIRAAGWAVTRKGNGLTVTRPGPVGKESRTTQTEN